MDDTATCGVTASSLIKARDVSLRSLRLAQAAPQLLIPWAHQVIHGRMSLRDYVMQHAQKNLNVMNPLLEEWRTSYTTQIHDVLMLSNPSTLELKRVVDPSFLDQFDSSGPTIMQMARHPWLMHCDTFFNTSFELCRCYLEMTVFTIAMGSGSVENVKQFLVAIGSGPRFNASYYHTLVNSEWARSASYIGSQKSGKQDSHDERAPQEHSKVAVDQLFTSAIHGDPPRTESKPLCPVVICSEGGPVETSCSEST